MGLTSSSLLDESKSSFIKGRARAELQKFAPYYRKQYSLAYLSHVHDELLHRKEEHTQLLKQREPLPNSKVLYEENALYFDNGRKWKERFTLVRANYALECHESYETYVKGTPPLFKLLPTGGTIFTTEDKYMEAVDKCFPDANSVKEDFAPPLAAMPGDLPVYLRLPYRRDYYFCFTDEEKQADFISALSNCIRHQNQDFLKKKSFEVQAFVKAMQFYRQDKGHYETWDMLIGSDVRVLANLTMEDLLPTLEQDLLPRLKAKKTERKRMWFATVEAAYYLVQETMMEGMNALKEECKETAMKKSAQMHSDMDQIMSSRKFLEGKLRAAVEETAVKYCSEQVEPHLAAVLEEVMGPISLGFTEARHLSEAMMEQLCTDYQAGMPKDQLRQALVTMSKPNLQSCYEKVSGLKDHIQELQQKFTYPNCTGLEHSTQIDIQQLMENVAYSFELLLHKAEEQHKDLGDAMMKAKHRVLKQYDYDSSTVRKKIFHDALISITLPSVKSHLAPAFKKELPKFDQYIFADHVNFINVENVYEDILQSILEADVSKVVKEAATMKKYNLFTDSRSHFSVSSLHSISPSSSPVSPARTGTAQTRRFTNSPSPLMNHGPDSAPASGLAPKEPDDTKFPEVKVKSSTPQSSLQRTKEASRQQAAEAQRTAESGVVIVKQDQPKKKNTLDINKMLNRATAGEGTVKVAPAEVRGLDKSTKADPIRSISAETPVHRACSGNTSPKTSTTSGTIPIAQPISKAVEKVANGTPFQTTSAGGDAATPVVEASKLVSTGVLQATANQSDLDVVRSGLETAHEGVVIVDNDQIDDIKAEIFVDEPTSPKCPTDEVQDETQHEETNGFVCCSSDNEDDTLQPEDSFSNEDDSPENWVVMCEAVPHVECVPQDENLGNLLVACEALPGSEVSLEAADVLVGTGNIPEENSYEDDIVMEPPPPDLESSQPSPGSKVTTVEPPSRPPDCIKEIRDLVVEVIEVEELLQRYPNDEMV